MSDARKRFGKIGGGIIKMVVLRLCVFVFGNIVGGDDAGLRNDDAVARQQNLIK